MKKTLLLVALFVAASVTVASAAGINVSWGNTCWSDAGHASSLTWACNSNSFTGVRMTCSYAVAVSKTNMVATDLYMEGATNDVGTAVPDWWKLGDSECRTSSSVVVLSADGSLGGGACQDLWGGAGAGGIGLYSDEGNRTHINATWAVPDPIAIDAGVETFAATFRIATTKTTGTGACAGCDVPLTWALNYIQVAYQGESTSEVLDQVLPSGNQCVTWQGGAAPCARPLPVRNQTWGQIKSLYR